MLTLLNIALLVVGSAATLAAFGGETWRKGTSPIFERITARGWLSLFCLASALFLGVAKELLGAKNDVAARAEADKERTSLTDKLNAAEEREKTSNRELGELNEVNKLIRKQLDGAQETLGTVKVNLSTTTEALNHESAAGLVSTLTTSGLLVRDMFLYIPLTNKVNSDHDVRHILLPHFNRSECDDLVGSEVDVRIVKNRSETLSYDSDDGMTTHADLQNNIPKLDDVLDLRSAPNPFYFQDVLALTGIKTHARSMYFVRFHPDNLSASQVYATLATTGIDIVEIGGYWPKTFKTIQDYKVAAKKYPKVFKDVDEADLPDIDVDLFDDHTSLMPGDCTEQIKEYFNAKFEGGELIVLLESQNKDSTISGQYITMFFRLKAQPVKETKDGNVVQVAVPFRVAAPPTFGAMDASELERYPVHWPQESR